MQDEHALQQTDTTIGIIGTGQVALNLARGLSRAGYSVVLGSRHPNDVMDRMERLPKNVMIKPQSEAVAAGSIVIIAVPFSSVRDTVIGIGPAKFRNKTVVDVTNAITRNLDLAIGFTTSGAEELSKMLPKTNVVKAFNTIFAEHMSTGVLHGTKLTMFACGDDQKSRSEVIRLAQDIGFEAIDAGPLKAARYLEPLGLLNISLAFAQRMGTKIGFKLVTGELGQPAVHQHPVRRTNAK